MEIETAGDRDDRERQLLLQIADEFPDMTVERVPGADWEAYPKDVTVLRAMTLDVMIGKLRGQGRPS
jgi:hypothetical protein